MTLAYMPERLSSDHEFHRPVLVADRSNASGDCVIIVLDDREKQRVQARLVAPTQQDADSNIFVLRFGSSSTILRLQAPNEEVYGKWTSAIKATIGSGHEHSTARTGPCQKCRIALSSNEVESIVGNLTIPRSVGKGTETLAVPTVLIPSGRWSYFSSSQAAKRACGDATVLSYQLHQAVIRGDYSEEWTMEARKNMLLRINHASLRIPHWTIESMFSVLRLRTACTFNPTFDIFADTKRIKRQHADAFAIMSTNFDQNIFVIADASAACECTDSGVLVGKDECCCRPCASKFRVYSPLYDHRNLAMPALEWLRRLSGEVLKAQRCPVIVHAKDRTTCSLLRFSELQVKPSSKNRSSPATIELTNSMVEQFAANA